MITIIVWSLDRPCQLELLLRSMYDKFHVDKRVVVQYRATTQTAEEGFQRVQQLYSQTEFKKETDFKTTLSDTLDTVTTQYIVFFTDDDVFLQDTEFIKFTPDEDVSAYSLRMNPDIDRCYPANNKKIKAPELSYNDIHMRWNWKEAEDQHCCWGYPMAVNSHIYRCKDIIPLIKTGKYHHPNSLECWLNRNRWHDKPYIISFTETKVYCVQNNFVQGPRQNEKHVCHHWLNEQFLKGRRISTKNIYGLKPKACHGTIDYKLEDL